MDLFFTGTVYLDVHAAASKTTQQDAILLTAAHELTHHIRLNAEAQYDALKEFVIEHLLDQGQDFETMVQDKLKEKGMSRADAVEEVIADACEMVLKDSKAVEKLAKENKSLAQTIADWLHGFYEDIKAAFEGVEARSKEAKAMTDYMDELVKLWDDALIEASKGESKQSNVIRYSFRKSTSGMANDKLSPYNEELSQYIKNGGDYIIDSFDALESAVNMAFDYPDKKATLYFGNVSPEDISRIEASIENLPTELKGKLFKPGRTYSVIATLDSIRHLKDEKNISTENVLKYMDRYADTVVDFDDVHFDYYFDSYGNRLNGLRFRKQFDDGFQVSFDIVSNKKRSLTLITEFIGGKTIKKKSAKTLPLNNSEAHTPKARAGQTSINIIDEVAGNVNTDIRYSRRDSSEGLTKEEARAQAQAYTRLKAENAALQRRLEYLQGQTRRTKQRTINRGDVDKYARQLIKMHGSTVDADWLKQKLREMGDYLVQTEELDYSVLNQMAWEISSAVIENAEAEDDSAAYDVSNEILNDFNGTTFHLNG